MGVKINVYGHIQGVNFRWYTQQIANKLGIYGFVRNEPDGSVYIEATSNNNDKLQEFIDDVRQSPSPQGHVTDINIQKANLDTYHDFKILR